MIENSIVMYKKLQKGYKVQKKRKGKIIRVLMSRHTDFLSASIPSFFSSAQIADAVTGRSLLVEDIMSSTFNSLILDSIV